MTLATVAHTQGTSAPLPSPLDVLVHGSPFVLPMRLAAAPDGRARVRLHMLWVLDDGPYSWRRDILPPLVVAVDGTSFEVEGAVPGSPITHRRTGTRIGRVVAHWLALAACNPSGAYAFEAVRP